jgi:hypothetical protein
MSDLAEQAAKKMDEPMIACSECGGTGKDFDKEPHYDRNWGACAKGKSRRKEVVSKNPHKCQDCLGIGMVHKGPP